MYEVTTTGFSGTTLTVIAHSNGELIDRFRYAMASEYVDSFKVVKK